MSSSDFVIVETEYGPVKGVRKSTVLGMDFYNFQGIPYMKAPVGKLRFRDAQPPEKWTEPLEPREVCYPDFNFFTNKQEGQEDAGIINVYTKNVRPEKKLPVMIWIHGGGFQTGSSKVELYGPDYILQKDVILVSINYRLNVFGFLSLDDPEVGVPGNAGLKDQSFALKFIKRNIEKFGGDSNNITVFGESAGGASTHYHMISEQSRGLFQKAIPMSGVALNNGWALQPRRNWGYRLAEVLGYQGAKTDAGILEFLETIDAQELVAATKKILKDEEKHGEKIIVPFGPQIEPYITKNCFIPKDPFLMAREAWSNESVDVMIGGVSNEGLILGYWFGVLIDFKAINILQDPKYFAPLIETGYKVDDPRSVEFGKTLKQVYYGCTEPSKSNTEGYFFYAGDYYFWHGLQRVAQIRASRAKGKTYFYRLDIVTKMNFFKSFSKMDHYPGTGHGEDLIYLFHGTYQDPPAIGSIEFENIKKCVDIFTTFAINGDPNCKSCGDVWTPMESAELPIKVLNIATEKNEFIELPETERLAVWNKIYEDAGLDIY